MLHIDFYKEVPYLKEWRLFQLQANYTPKVREIVLKSWQEAESLGLNGQDQPKSLVLSESQFKPIHNRSIHLIKTVEKGINALYNRVKLENPHAICLFNDQGVLLHVYGDHKALKENLQPLNLQPGLLGGFPFHGHTAVSLSLKTKSVQYLIGAEHFYSAYHSFSSFAAPLFHPLNQEIIGCISLISKWTPSADGYLAMLTSISLTIEEAMKREYNIVNKYKIHDEITNIIDLYILIIGPDLRILNCNTTLLKFFKDTPLIGKKVAEFLEECQVQFDSEITLSTLLLSFQEGEEFSNFELWITLRGKRYCITIDTKILRDPFDPRFFWIVVLAKDITIKKELDQQWLQREKMVSLGKLAAGLAHEIRNPLTTAKGFIQFLSESSPDKEKFALIHDELDRITQLVNEFVLLSKPDFPHMKIYMIQDLVEEFVTFIKPEALLHGIEVKISFLTDNLYIRVDKHQLTQVFINLAQNAFQAMKNGGTLTIAVEERSDQEENWVEIRFIDDGTGISEEVMAHIFDPFFSTKEAGTGIGLSICYQILAAHKGYLKIKSKVEEGTCVYVRLPKYQSL